MFKIPKELNFLANILPKPIYIVGGFVRDSLLNIDSKDFDLCSSLTVEELADNLKNTEFKVIPNNLQFGTAKIICNLLTVEYSTFRKDFYANNGKHSPKKVMFVNTIEEDCLRRDFTINSIYYNLKTNQIVDPLNGQDDLKNKILKAVPPVENTLLVDGERLLRLAKFKAKTGFKIEENTLKYAKLYSNNVLQLSKNTIDKFLKNISGFTTNQKQEIKDFFKELNLEQLSNIIKEEN